MAATRPISESPGDPNCPTCKGAGFYVRDVHYGDADFSRLIRCHCKDDEIQQRRSQKLLQISNLEPFRDKTFDNFDGNIAGVGRAFIRSLDYANNPRGWLVLYGNYGCGKTHLAAAIANQILTLNYQVLFTVVPDILDHLRSTFGPSSEVAYDERFEQIRNAKLLILDDLGTENATPWAREKLYQIINHRYNYALPTVITSNRDPESIDARIRSRMNDVVLSEQFLIEAGDYRRLTVEQRSGTRRRKVESRFSGVRTRN